MTQMEGKKGKQNCKSSSNFKGLKNTADDCPFSNTEERFCGIVCRGTVLWICPAVRLRKSVYVCFCFVLF